MGYPHARRSAPQPASWAGITGPQQGGTTQAMATTTLDALNAAARDLSAFRAEAKTGRFPADYATTEIARLTRAVAAADDVFRAAMRKDQADALQRARTLRAAAEAAKDPTTRLADLTEKKALVEGPLDADALLARAQEMLAAEQPARAALLLDAAIAKGVRGLGLHDTMRAVEDALDADGPRFEARTIEVEAERADAQAAAARMKVLTDSGVGILADGSVGRGAPGQAASADLAAKVAAWYGGQTKFPVGDGAGE